MSLRKIDAYCPTCKVSHPVEVEVTDPPPKEIIKETIKDNPDLERSLEAVRADLEKWQSGENHLQAPDMLRTLESCPNCRPTLDAFVAEIRNSAVTGLSLDQVKDLAKQHKLWPPPTIDLTPGLSRKARP